MARRGIVLVISLVSLAVLVCIAGVVILLFVASRGPSIGSLRIVSQAPHRVIWPMLMPPQDGIQSMMENTMPSVCAQSGTAV